MMSINLPTSLEKRLHDVVQKNYHGDLQVAISTFLKLHEKYGWKEQLLKDVKSVRDEVRRKGGIKKKTIDDAVKRYRKGTGTTGA